MPKKVFFLLFIVNNRAQLEPSVITKVNPEKNSTVLKGFPGIPLDGEQTPASICKPKFLFSEFVAAIKAGRLFDQKEDKEKDIPIVKPAAENYHIKPVQNVKRSSGTFGYY